MKIDWGLVVNITIPIISAILGAYLFYRFERRPRLVTWLGHASAFLVQPSTGGTPIQVHTHSVVILNEGKKAATNVRVGHHILPVDYNVYPSVHYQLVGTEIVFPTLVPKEQVTISYLYFPPTLVGHVNSYTKSDEGQAEFYNLLPTKNYSAWLTRMAAFFVFCGIASVLYLVISIIQYLLSHS